MSHCTPLARLTASLLALSLALFALALPARAAEPGVEMISFSGTVGAGLTRTLALTESGPANMRLMIGGGSASDKATLSVLTSAGATVASWPALSGETIWATAELPAGGRLRLETTATSLSFALKVFARGTILAPTDAAPQISGVLTGSATTSSGSAVQLTVLKAGLYSFAMGADSGAFQLVVDDNYVRKTVVSGAAPAPADSTYYLSAGNHTFTVVPSKVGQTAWSLRFTWAGELDALPYGEAASALGGAFTEEWIPIQVPEGVDVNLSVAVTGAAGNKLTVELYSGSAPAASVTLALIAGGETIWGTGQLTAGASRLHIITAGANNGTLGYSIALSPIGSPELTITGTSQGASAVNSQARVSFPSDGLYRFTLAASAGRYQLRVGETSLRRIVTSAGADTLTAFIPAGTHQLVIDQDSALGATWSVTVAETGQAFDTLPFTRSGATLAGAPGEFADEWLPIALSSGGAFNIRVAATDGAEPDHLRLEVARPGAAPSFTLAAIYQGENTWATTTLEAGASLLRVSAADGNSRPMSYTLEIQAVQRAPSTVAGVSHHEGLDASFAFMAPEEGIYTLTLSLQSGAGQILVDQEPARPVAEATLADDTVLTQRVELKAGLHRITFERDVTQPVSAWSITTGLLRVSRYRIYMPVVGR